MGGRWWAGPSEASVFSSDSPETSKGFETMALHSRGVEGWGASALLGCDILRASSFLAM